MCGFSRAKVSAFKPQHSRSWYQPDRAHVIGKFSIVLRPKLNVWRLDLLLAGGLRPPPSSQFCAWLWPSLRTHISASRVEKRVCCLSRGAGAPGPSPAPSRGAQKLYILTLALGAPFPGTGGPTHRSTGPPPAYTRVHPCPGAPPLPNNRRCN